MKRDNHGVALCSKSYARDAPLGPLLEVKGSFRVADRLKDNNEDPRPSCMVEEVSRVYLRTE